MSREKEILEALRDEGYRITPQRRLLMRLILSQEYESCKEIYYAAKKIDNRVGIATVYRTIQLLESMDYIKKELIIKID